MRKIASLSHVAWAEYAFYVLILIVFYAVVIRPVIRVHRAPQIPALSIDGEWDTARLIAFGHKLADNCNYIPKDKTCPELRKLHQQKIREDLERYATDKEELVQILSDELKLRIEGGELREGFRTTCRRYAFSPYHWDQPSYYRMGKICFYDYRHLAERET